MLIFLILLIAIVVHVVSEFRKKAELTGEAELSLTARNILPASRTCKICSLVTLTGLLLTGLLMLFEGSGTNWSLLQLSESQWKNIHLGLLSVFIVTFGLHLYTHSNWLKNMLRKKKHISLK
ncbi:MAG TPA: DUF4405 domain-containing protein [Ignavibacteria bacterium]|nr:DUF4405 domain-containing protein [Ignavibacteria bacterium]